MNSLKIYKLLTGAAGDFNALAVKLSNEKISKEEATEQARTFARNILEQIEDMQS